MKQETRKIKKIVIPANDLTRKPMKKSLDSTMRTRRRESCRVGEARVFEMAGARASRKWEVIIDFTKIKKGGVAAEEILKRL